MTRTDAQTQDKSHFCERSDNLYVKQLLNNNQKEKFFFINALIHQLDAINYIVLSLFLLAQMSKIHSSNAD